jgi:hypothetical protein
MACRFGSFSGFFNSAPKKSFEVEMLFSSGKGSFDSFWGFSGRSFGSIYASLGFVSSRPTEASSLSIATLLTIRFFVSFLLDLFAAFHDVCCCGFTCSLRKKIFIASKTHV